MAVSYTHLDVYKRQDKYTGIEFVNLIADFKAWWKDQWQQGNYQYYDLSLIHI